MSLRNDLLDVTVMTSTSYSIQISQGPGCHPEPCRRVLCKVPIDLPETDSDADKTSLLEEEETVDDSAFLFELGLVFE